MTPDPHSAERPARPIASRRGPAIVSLGLGLISLIALDALIAAQRPREENRAAALRVQPREDRIFLLGNSMFKTGIDREALEREIDAGIGVDFEEHVGHYTNLWYLIVKNALVDHPETPRRVVWGFRPTYAYRPAFRQKRVCDVERFLGPSETLYEHLVSQANRDDSGGWRAALARHSGLYPRRDAIREKVFSPFESAAIALLGVIGGPATPSIEADLGSGLSLSELVHKRLHHDANRVAEEAYVDAGAGFVLGEVVPFEQSFVPHIAELLRERAIPQLVVLFNPVAATAGGIDPQAAAFTEAAVAYFDAHDIPYLDMVNDPDLTPAHYASGDHYNAAGRALVTAKLARKLRRLEATPRAEGIPLADRKRP